VSACRHDPHGQVAGPVRIGTVQDFAETLLSGVLARFADLHPEAQIYVRVAGTAELLGLLEKDGLDLIVGYAAADDGDAVSVTPMRWFGSHENALKEVVPLAVLERPCRFREAAIASLDALGRPWRIAVETPNLSSLRAAVEAGLGLTCRTHQFLPTMSALEMLPPLPDVATIVRRAKGAAKPAARLGDLASDVLRSL